MQDVVSDEKISVVSFFSEHPMTPQQRVGAIVEILRVGHFQKLDEIIAEIDDRAVNATVAAVATIMEFHVVPAYIEIIDMMIDRGFTTQRLQAHSDSEVSEFISSIPSTEFVVAKQCEESLMKIAVACGMDMELFSEECICEVAMQTLQEFVPEHGHVLPGETDEWNDELFKLYFVLTPTEAVRIALLYQVNMARSYLTDEEWGKKRTESFGESDVHMLTCTIIPDEQDSEGDGTYN